MVELQDQRGPGTAALRAAVRSFLAEPFTSVLPYPPVPANASALRMTSFAHRVRQGGPGSRYAGAEARWQAP